MLKREDFPPGVPKETVDRLLAMSVRAKVSVVVAILTGIGIAAVVIALARNMGWPAWTYGLSVPVTGGIGAIWQLFNARRMQKVLVAMGHTCPKCQQRLNSDTWSMAKAKAERDAVLQGYCPRCFERVFPNITAMAEEMMASKR